MLHLSIVTTNSAIMMSESQPKLFIRAPAPSCHCCVLLILLLSVGKFQVFCVDDAAAAAGMV